MASGPQELHLKVGHKRGGVLAQGAAVDGLAASPQQKQLIKSLRRQSTVFPQAGCSWEGRPRNGNLGA